MHLTWTSCDAQSMPAYKHFSQLTLSFLLLQQAQELLRHPHLQPYVLKIQLQINNPRRTTLSAPWSEPSKIKKKTRFSDPIDVHCTPYRDKRTSFSDNRALNPSISEAEQDSVSYTKGRDHDMPAFFNRRLDELSIASSHEGTVICKTVSLKKSSIKPSLSKASAITRRQSEPLRNQDPVCSLSFAFSLEYIC